MIDHYYKILKEENVDFLQLQFVDILGIPKAVEVPFSQVMKALQGDIKFDGSSIEGFTRIIESDMALRPDLDTLVIFEHQGLKIARFVCDVMTSSNEEFQGCPRINLKRVVAEIKERLGFTMMVGPEAEFFLLQKEAIQQGTLEFNDHGSYFDLLPLDGAAELRRAIVKQLESLKIEVEALHHEVAPAQHEIDFKYADALKTADNLVLFKSVIKTEASRRGILATFMPKPIGGINGSGMHIHVSLWKDGKNAFYDPGDTDYGLSETARYFIAGVLKHARALTAIANPLINSYKRLVPGYEAPVDVAWAPKNRSPMIRLPQSEGDSKRIEIRSPDPAANPYLLFAAVLTAGVDGIDNRIEAPEPVNEDMYTVDDNWKRNRNIISLPSFLSHALRELEQNEVIQKAMTPHILKLYLDNKWFELRCYQQQVHEWEREKYIHLY